MDSEENVQVVEKRYERKDRMKSQVHQNNQNNNNSPSTPCMDSSFLLSTLLNKHNEMPKKVLEKTPKSQPENDTENTSTAVTTTDVNVEENKVQRNYSALQSHFKKPYQLWSPFSNYKKLVSQRVPLKFTPWKPMYQQMEDDIAVRQFVSQSSTDNCSICLKRNFNN